MKKIYTDGACKKNPGKGGWAFIMLDGENRDLDQGVGSNPMTTNNVMEMQAVIEGLQKTDKGEKVEVYSDSAYVVNCFKDDWISGWKKKGWKNSKRQDVKNRELWETMDVLVNERHVEFIKVKAHSTDEFNNRVDKMASDAAREA